MGRCVKNRKDILLESCPMHGCQPMLYGKNIELDIRSIAPELYRAWQYCKSYVLHRIFPDALLFESGYTVFCPECAKKNPFNERHNKFGYGFCSQYSLNEAKRNWNNACKRFYKSQVKRDLHML